MPIIGMNFKFLEAQRKDTQVKGEIKINSFPKITNVKEAKVSNMKSNAVALEFEFSTDYEPDVGKIKLMGELLYQTDKQKEILDKWKKEKKISEDLGVEVLNHLFRRCLLKSAHLSEEVMLPPPLQMPRIKPKEKQEHSYIG